MRHSIRRRFAPAVVACLFASLVALAPPSGAEAAGTTLIVSPAEITGLSLSAVARGIDAVDGVEVLHEMGHLGLVAVEVTDAGRSRLSASGLAESIEEAGELHLLLDESRLLVEADVAEAAGFDGSGSVVAVIDSGVDATHPALAGRVVAEACFLFGTGPAQTCPGGGKSNTGSGSAAPCTTNPAECDHGTHVAGTVASADATHRGVAPATGIAAVRVMSENIQITEAAVLAALDHVLSLASTYDIAAVNMSLGGSADLCSSSAWDSAIDSLDDAGIAVVAASGNSADAAVSPETRVAFPACLDGVVAVGATERTDSEGLAEDDDPELTTFTQYDGALDLVAPGFGIVSTIPGPGTGSYSGTSMAAPHVAGAYAVLHGTQTGWTPERFQELLRTTGVMIERYTADPDDRHDRYPELRLADAIEFEPFVDAGEGFWVAAADWAKHTGVSNGIGQNEFGPEQTLDRAQAVTFLWRLMGSPAPSEPGPFDDVDPAAWFADPVAWAFENGITTGASPTTFEPESDVTRAQMATFMWRLVGEPDASPSGFSDVPDDTWYTVPVDWMAETGVTTGTSPTTFSPDDVVTRAQMITFVWRLVNAPAAWSGSTEPPDLAMF